jgi:hypothetical protein
MRRFLFDSWVPTKLDVSIPLKSHVDLEDLRGKGLQPGEEELPAASAGPAAPTPDAGIVSQLEGMGFGKNAATRAVSRGSDSTRRGPPFLPSSHSTAC